jgi:hypothetical protein
MCCVYNIDMFNFQLYWWVLDLCKEMYMYVYVCVCVCVCMYVCMYVSVAYQGGVWSVQTPPWNSEVLTKLSRIPSSVENTSVTV